MVPVANRPAEPLRTPEQMEWIRDRFKPDGLQRLARSTQDYYDQKGYYLPDVAALAYENGVERDALLAERDTLADALRAFFREYDGNSVSMNGAPSEKTEMVMRDALAGVARG